MENNPYAPPKAPVEDQVSSDGEPTAASTPLYSPAQMAVAAFLGSAMAGAWLAAMNFNAVGQLLKARRTLWLGLVVTIVTLVIAAILPDRFPGIVLPMAVAFGVKGLAETHFGAMFREHQKAKGAVRSWWRVVGISLLIAAVVIVLLGVAMFIYKLVEQSIQRP